VPVPRAGERAFTLIELLIAGVLGVLVIGMASLALMGMFSGSSGLEASERSDVKAGRLSERLAGDLRDARAIDRAGSDAPTADELRDILFRRTSEPRAATGHAGSMDLRDIASAGPTRLVFQADVASDPLNAGLDATPECITWEVVTDSPGGPVGDWAIVRTVRAWTSGCATAGAQLDREVIVGPVDPNIRGAAAPGALFAYRTRVNIAASTCTNQAAAAGVLDDVTTNRVVSVSVNLTAGERRAGQASSEQSGTDITIRARQAADYRTAMGCT